MFESYINIRTILSSSLSLTFFLWTHQQHCWTLMDSDGLPAPHALLSQMYLYNRLQSASFHSLRFRIMELWSCPQSSPFSLKSQSSGWPSSQKLNTDRHTKRKSHQLTLPLVWTFVASLFVLTLCLRQRGSHPPRSNGPPPSPLVQSRNRP